jgi:hypothetical protein
VREIVAVFTTYKVSFAFWAEITWVKVELTTPKINFAGVGTFSQIQGESKVSSHFWNDVTGLQCS